MIDGWVRIVHSWLETLNLLFLSILFFFARILSVLGVVRFDSFQYTVQCVFRVVGWCSVGYIFAFPQAFLLESMLSIRLRVSFAGTGGGGRLKYGDEGFGWMGSTELSD